MFKEKHVLLDFTPKIEYFKVHYLENFSDRELWDWRYQDRRSQGWGLWMFSSSTPPSDLFQVALQWLALKFGQYALPKTQGYSPINPTLRSLHLGTLTGYFEEKHKL